MTETEQGEKAFMDAIWENPDDDNCRLVFADWLDDNPIPDAHLNEYRAELIRLQIDLSIWEPGYSLDMGSPRCHDNSMNPKIKRAIELARWIIHGTKVLGSGYSSGNTIWRRGFVEEVHRIPWYDWWKHGDALRQWHPVRHVFTDEIRIRRLTNFTLDSLMVAFELSCPMTYRSSADVPKMQEIRLMHSREYNALSPAEAIARGREIAVSLAEDKWKGTKFHMNPNALPYY